MLRRKLGLLAIGFGGALALAACSSDDGDGGGTAGAGGSGGGEGPDPTCQDDPSLCIVEPVDPGVGPGTGTETTLAVSKLYLGDTDRAGNASSSAWKDYGYNLDGIISTKSGTNHCQPVEGANPANVKTDGTGGIDNSFGSNLVPLLLSLAADMADSVNDAISGGDFTIMLNMANLSAEANQSAIDSKLYAGAAFDALVDCDADPTLPECAGPMWDGSDSWPVVPELLNNPSDITSAKVAFPGSFVADGTWASGSKGTLDLSIAIQGFELTLSIKGAVITMDVDGTGPTASASNGVIAGVLNTEELISELRKVAGALDASLCEGSTFDSIAQQLRTASDIMADGSNGDPSKTCDGISIGLGFDAQGVTLGGIAPPSDPGTDPCAP